MSLGVAIAIYAALVGTASLGWQIYSARRAAQHGIKVEFSDAILGMPVHSLTTVCIKAINSTGQRPIAITGVGLETQNGSGEVFVQLPGPPSTIPGSVEPGHALAQYFDVAPLEANGFDPKRPLVGFVNLATGEQVRSTRTTLRS